MAFEKVDRPLRPIVVVLYTSGRIHLQLQDLRRGVAITVNYDHTHTSYEVCANDTDRYQPWTVHSRLWHILHNSTVPSDATRCS